jgi:hypothetical protein
MFPSVRPIFVAVGERNAFFVDDTLSRGQTGHGKMVDWKRGVGGRVQ